VQATLARASTITIVVHGVGDHSAVNILAEAERGFSTMMAGSGSRFEVARLPEAATMLPEGASDLSISGAQITTENGAHVMLALVWSATRQRLHTAMRDARQAPKFEEYRGGGQVILASWLVALGAHWWMAIGESLRVLWTRIQLDLLRLPARAHGFWRLGVGAGVFAVFLFGLVWTLTAVTVAALFVVGVQAAGEVNLEIWRGLGKTDGVWTGPRAPLGAFVPFLPDWVGWWIQDWFHWGLLAGVTLLLAVFVLQGVKIIDLIADVATYVANDAHRRRVINIVEQVIDRVLSAGAGSRVFLVGHSLGSTLVSHVLAQKQVERPVTLVTLGSPLPLMARAFEDVHSPEALRQIYRESGNVECWINAFRDGDVIGRSLFLQPGMGYIECALGSGPHWNYFSDVRLWKRMAALLQADPQDDYTGYRTMIAAWEIEGCEERELRGCWFVLGLSFILLPTAVVAERALWAFLFAPDAQYLLGHVWTIAYSLSLASGSALAAGAVMLVLATANFMWGKTRRQKLQAARLWRVLVLIFPSLQILLALAALVLCLWRAK
jgi:hypothetical protein